MNKIVKSLGSFLLVIAIFYFLGLALYNSYGEISSFEFSINWPLALLSFVFPVAFFLLMGYAWKLCLALFGSMIPSSKGIYYWCKSQLGKYLPGTIWYALGRAHFLSRDNVPKQDAFASMILEMIFLADASLILALLFLNAKIANVISVYAALGLVLLGIISVHPSLLNFLISKFKKLNVRLKRNYNYILILLLFYIFISLVACIGFYIFSMSIYPRLNFYYVVGSFALSYFFGLVVVFSPGGLGVREGFLSLMLSAVMPLPLAIIIAFAARIWWTLAELSSIAISWYFLKISSN